MYTLDPANERGSLASGIAALDQYLASTDSTGFYRNEALVLRRTAAAAQGVTVVAGTPSVAPPSSAPGKDTVVVVTRTRDEEIAALKDQLAKSEGRAGQGERRARPHQEAPGQPEQLAALERARRAYLVFGR